MGFNLQVQAYSLTQIPETLHKQKAGA